MEPVLVGALVWLGQIIAARGIERLMDAAMNNIGDRQAGAAPIRRHDLTAPGTQVSSDVDITLRHHQPGSRTPAILTVQTFHDRTSGNTLPMVVGETAHLTLARGHYLFAALVIDLPQRQGDKHTLRGLGWASLWLASNATTPLLIGARHSSEELVDEIGLKQRDGTLPFTLPPAPPAAPLLTPNVPAAQRIQQFFDQPSIHARRFQPGLSRQVNPHRCRARAWVGEKQCEFLPFQNGLCRIHREQAGAGRDVLDHGTGQPIILP